MRACNKCRCYKVSGMELKHVLPTNSVIKFGNLTVSLFLKSGDSVYKIEGVLKSEQNNRYRM